MNSMPMALHVAADDRSVENIQGSEVPWRL
jgi:hypothetical protein